MKVKIVFIILFILSTTKNYSNESTKIQKYTLIDVLNLSFQNSDLLRSKEKELASYKGLIKQANAWQNPNISFDMGKKNEGGFQGEAYNASINQPLYFPGKKRLRKNIVEQDRKSSEISVYETKLEIYSNVIFLSFAFNESKELVRHLEERKDRLSLISSYLKNRPFASSQKIVEKNLINMKLLLIEKDLLTTQLKQKKYWENLNFYLKEKNEIELEIDWYVTGIDLKYEEILTETMTSNPSLQVADIKINKKEIEKKLSEKEKYPDISLSGYVNQEKAELTQRMFGAGLTFHIPVWNRNTGETKSLALQKQSIQSYKKYLINKLESDSKELWIEFTKQKLILQKYPVSTLRQIDRDMEFAETEFIKGKIDILSFLELENTVSQLHSMVFGAQLDYVKSYLSVLNLMGKMDFKLEEKKE